MNRAIWSFAVWLLLVQPGILAGQQGQDIVSGAGTSYTLRPGDIVRIDVWGREDFSGRFQVDESGTIQYPILGEFSIADLTVAQLRERIREGLEQLFNQPFVTITPLFRMAVIGEVRTPGLYTVDPTLSVLDVVAMAGGTTQNGDLNNVRLFRGGRQSRVQMEGDQVEGRTLLDIGVRSGDQIVVPKKAWTRDDWFLLLQMAQVALSIAIFISVQ